MNVVAIIPARMGSTRFPGKPMAPLQGIPMIGHVYERTRLSRTVSETYAATCDKEIHDYILSIGGKSVMTSDRHERASDRAAEAMLKIEEQTGKKVDIAVMVQGDEPMVFPEMIDAAVSLMLEDRTLDIACLMAAIQGDKDFEDPNLVKVAVDLKGFALYFSREPIPSRKKWKGELPKYKQVPIIPFKRDYLLRFNSLPPTPLEAIESVDLLRVLEHGDKVKMAITTRETLSVDTPADLARADGAMKADKLLPAYSKVKGLALALLAVLALAWPAAASWNTDLKTVPGPKRLAQILYGDNEDACTVDGKLLYDLSTRAVTLAARCQKTYVDGGWQWALNTLATFPSDAVPGQPYALKKVAFHDEDSCGRYRLAAEKLSTEEVSVTSACRPAPQPSGKVWSVLETSVALR